jgi:DNA-damage-inducible protein D
MENLPTEPAKNFESARKIDENGVEYWTARELMLLLGYSKWTNFETVIKKSKVACNNSGQFFENHFADIGKMVDIGSNTVRKVGDYRLDRYACYLIAQNGDSSKPEIALAQTYFTIQTRKQEIFEKLPDAEKRLFIRGEVSDWNKKLFKTAKQSGVSNFGLFNDAGYRGLYGMPLTSVEKKKGINKGELLDRAGSTELAANLFRITQTDEKIHKDKIVGDDRARHAHFMVGGKVRQTIKDIGGELPENLKPEKHIREVKKAIGKLEREKQKQLKNK